ncbi:Lpxtg-domain-containing protein [Pleurostoma richardsiae]|uniref:Lpxtg-domain-containing protein n=1 Tax=Pleurostoma richardsiae TaxID=41990 RepID=A0AA38VHX2_9PEZI|nr:Lpxtg-domain-containing protein [Pleurostoma richardsiae]
MARAARRLFVSTALAASSTTALLVAPASPCGTYCGNVLTSTTGSEITCDESQYSASAGVVFESCTNCELSSTYSSQGQTDLQWLLYNLRFAISWCVFGDPGNKNAGDNPCITGPACGPLKDALEWENFTTSTGAYDYCNSWVSVQVPKCSACLTAGDEHYLNNFLTMLDAGCQQEPSVGSTLSVKGSPFSTVPMNITSPSASPSYASIATDSGPISLAGKVGIAVGGFVFLLFLAGFCVVWNGKRRRRAFLRRLEMRQKQPGPSWAPQGGLVNPRNAELHDTPLSQKPLRSWDDSPISAGSEAPRYFSPYVSLHNSPVSASDQPSMAWPQSFPSSFHHGFPSSAQEKMMQDLHDHQQAQQYPQQQQQQQQARNVEIGLALGGDTPSMRSQASYPSLGEGKGKQAQDSYEMHEVDSAGGYGNSNQMPMPPSQAPVLQHPGYGRHSPPESIRHAGLTEEDARRGNAL